MVPRDHLAFIAGGYDQWQRCEVSILIAPPSTSAASLDVLKAASLRGDVQKAQTSTQLTFKGWKIVVFKRLSHVSSDLFQTSLVIHDTNLFNGYTMWV